MQRVQHVSVFHLALFFCLFEKYCCFLKWSNMERWEFGSNSNQMTGFILCYTWYHLFR